MGVGTLFFQRRSVIMPKKIKRERPPVTKRRRRKEPEPCYSYLSGYSKPKDLAAQARRLRSLFPGLDYTKINPPGQALPSAAEGWFLIPQWDRLAPSRGAAVRMVHGLIKQTRRGGFQNYLDVEFGSDHFRQSSKCASLLQRISDEQGNPDIVVVAAQFGLHHRDRPVSRACALMGDHECGLGSFEAGIMLLTHQERLGQSEDLWVGCAGDEFSPRKDGNFSRSPCYCHVGDGIGFGAVNVSCSRSLCGTSSMFVS